LYADITSPEFPRFHHALSSAARSGKQAYRVRYRRPAGERPRLPISGYGVELALKRTDYIVIDDREAAPSPEDTKQQAVLSTDDEFADLKPLSTSELASLSIKAADFILESDDPLDTLVRLSQDLPKFSTSLASHEVSESFLQEHRVNRKRLGPAGANALWINGFQLDERQVEPFGLLDTLRKDRQLVSTVQQFGVKGLEAIGFLEKAFTQRGQGPDRERFDWRDAREEGKAILWLNDIETDAAYERFPETYDAVCCCRSALLGAIF
jgi:UDP-glucose:glycoprotein glucosyltransferase